MFHMADVLEELYKVNNLNHQNGPDTSPQMGKLHATHPSNQSKKMPGLLAEKICLGNQ